MAREEGTRLEAEHKRLTLIVQRGILPPDVTDSRNTIIEIRAGAGGNDPRCSPPIFIACTPEYAEGRRWKVETLDSSPRTWADSKKSSSVYWSDTFKRLKYESGVHRSAARSGDEASGRIHTSTATVAVLPEAEEVDIAHQARGLEISVCRASGPGGQGVNTTDSAVQIIYKPTGMIVRCADQRSQQKNKIRAMTFCVPACLNRRFPKRTPSMRRNAKPRSEPANATSESAPIISRRTGSLTIVSNSRSTICPRS